jgi:hypothetical protein
LFAHTAITPLTGVKAMRADRPVAAERPSRRAGEPGGSTDARAAARRDAPGRVLLEETRRESKSLRAVIMREKE